MSRECPSCGEPLNAGRCTSCAYGRSSRTGGRDESDPTQRNRCSYFANGLQCRWIGSASDSWGTGELLCGAHWKANRHDHVEGRNIVEASHQKVTEGFDYSSEAIVRRTRDGFRRNVAPPTPLSPAQAEAFASKHPNVAARIGLHQHRLDEANHALDEERLEREALQHE